MRARSLGMLVLIAGLGLGASGRGSPARGEDPAPARRGKGSTGDRKVALLELYASQGCSSCPPAEDAVRELASKGLAREKVVVAAFHVDYWDVPWKDPFSDARWTERQKAVARALRQESYYTPELVWDGLGHSSDMGDVRRGLEKALGAKARAALALEAKLEGARLTVEGKATPARGERLEAGLAVEVLVLEDDLATEVPRGENAGRTLRETCVVRDVALAATVEKATGEALAWKAGFDVGATWRRESLHVAAVLRDPVRARVWQALDVALVGSGP